jgi:hypothetical protein
MLMRPGRGVQVPRHVSYLALLLAPLLGLGLPMRDTAAAAGWRQEAPQTTGPGGVETTVPPTTKFTATSPSTTEPCATTTTDTAATQPCLPSTTAPLSTTAGQLVGPVIDALRTVTADVVAGPAAAGSTTTQNPTSILATTKDAPTSVQVAKEPGGNVEVAGAGAQMAVGLPAGQGITSQRADGNIAVFAAPDPAQADVAVQPRDTGARVMVIIRSPDEPQTYRFPVHIPRGGRLAPMAHGKSGAHNTPEERNTTGYVILDGHDEGVGSIAAPWAQDSAGNPVPTWYTREPGAIVQHVAHIGAHYPVVADPLLSVGCAWFKCTVWFSASVTSRLAHSALLGQARFAEAATRLCLKLRHPVAIAVCGALSAVLSQALIDTLKGARDRHACLRVTFTPLGSPIRFTIDSSTACGRGAEAGSGRVAPLPPGSQPFVNNRSVTFTAVGGALFWIPNRDQLSLLVGGGDPWRRVRRISTSQVRRYRDTPVDGTLFQEVSNSRAYYVSAGHCWYVSAEQFVRRGFKPQNIRKVPDGGLRQCPYAGDLPPLAVAKAPLPPPRTSPPSTAPPKNCDPAYPDQCLQDGIGDWDCAGGSGNGPNYVEGPLTVRPPDPFDLDRNHNGVGCEERNS